MFLQLEVYGEEDIDNEVVMGLNCFEEEDSNSVVMFEGLVRYKDVYYDNYEEFKDVKTAKRGNKSNGRSKIESNLTFWERGETLLNHPNCINMIKDRLNYIFYITKTKFK